MNTAIDTFFNKILKNFKRYNTNNYFSRVILKGFDKSTGAEFSIIYHECMVSTKTPNIELFCSYYEYVNIHDGDAEITFVILDEKMDDLFDEIEEEIDIFGEEDFQSDFDMSSSCISVKKSTFFKYFTIFSQYYTPFAIELNTPVEFFEIQYIP